MRRFIHPDQWQTFYNALAIGYSRTQAARNAGISLQSVQRFERGDPSSSGHIWANLKRRYPCPTCGNWSGEPL